MCEANWMKLFNTIWSRLVALESLYERGPSYLFSHRLTKRWNEKKRNQPQRMGDEYKSLVWQFDNTGRIWCRSWRLPVLYDTGTYPLSQENRTLCSSWPITLPLTNFQNSFTSRLSSDCVDVGLLKILQHLKRFDTLPCEKPMFKNWCNQHVN